MFEKYNNATLADAMSRAKKAFAQQVGIERRRVSSGERILAPCWLLPLTLLACLWHEVKPAICAFHSAVVPTHSNLRRNLEEDSYVSALDPDYVQMSDGVSRLGFGFGAEEEDDDDFGHR